MAKGNSRDTLDQVVMFEQLKDQGVVEVYTTFDGSGDEGYVEDCVFRNINGQDIQVDATIARYFNDLVDHLTEKGPDWWNNDGGNGDITIEVATGEYTVNYNIRRTEYDESTDSGHISEKADSI